MSKGWPQDGRMTHEQRLSGFAAAGAQKGNP